MRPSSHSLHPAVIDLSRDKSAVLEQVRGVSRA